MKTATDLEQSKLLAKILPKESADTCYTNQSYKGLHYVEPFELCPKTPVHVEKVLDEAFCSWREFWQIIPAWSLSALLAVMPYNASFNKAVYRFKMAKFKDHWECYHENWGSVSTEVFKAEDPIDACVNLIVELHKEGMI